MKKLYCVFSSIEFEDNTHWWIARCFVCFEKAVEFKNKLNQLLVNKSFLDLCEFDNSIHDLKAKDVDYQEWYLSNMNDYDIYTSEIEEL